MLKLLPYRHSSATSSRLPRTSGTLQLVIGLVLRTRTDPCLLPTFSRLIEREGGNDRAQVSHTIQLALHHEIIQRTPRLLLMLGGFRRTQNMRKKS